MAVISMKQFLEAGVHFGHQTKRWHPKMSPYIYGVKNGVHVIDLRQTLTKLKEAYEYVKASAEEGRVPLFVGTKTQIQRIVKEEADRCGSPYINFRWLGGLLTNFGTVKQSIARMKSFEEIAGEDGNYEGVIKKEALMMERKRVKLARSLGGVRNMKNIPSMLFITDCHREQLALKEAQKLGIPVVGVSDTNCDPTGIDFMIPGNDDSPRAVALYASVISTAVMEGLALRKQNRIDSAPVEKAPAKKAKPVAKDSAGKSGVAPEKKAGSAPIKTEKKSLVAKAKDSAKPKPAAAKPKPAAAKAKAAEEKAPAAEVKVAEKKAPAAEAKVAEKKAPAKKAKPAAKVKAVAKKVDGASEGKTVEKKPTAVKATKKSDAEK
ncbi:MAG: 30S ribosomal protein S2 [SAR324 cluster bacterium]|nr:30S ribosomal protein S2 [SAR324 cluster bacterium]MDP7170712.1 30S ribosomal protein S2 [SAR324 cluster bacterium]